MQDKKMVAQQKLEQQDLTLLDLSTPGKRGWQDGGMWCAVRDHCR